jgi:hypothetical protein
MAGNAIPIFSKVARIEWAAAITAANAALDGTGTVNIVFGADATNGSYLQKLVVRPKGTNVASVLRLFMNNGATNATATNNVLIGEYTLPATTASAVAALAGFEIPLNIPMPPNYDLLVTLGTAVAGGYAICAMGGDY